MFTLSRPSTALILALAAFAGATAPAAAAQPAADFATRASVPSAEWSASRSDARAADLVRQESVEYALRSFGYRANRLSRQEQRALEQSFTELFPGRDARRHRLTETQATALVYVALVHDARHGSRRPNQRGACDGAIRQVNELDRVFDAPGRGRPRHLTSEEQRALIREAGQIERLAISCGERRLADQASELAELAADRRTERDRVARHVERMKGTVWF
jgi:hypothetical protein